MECKKVIILGAGLTGLYLAHLLKKEKISFQILEARNRVGGRILTHYQKDSAPIEMGATWFGEKHRKFKQVISELNIHYFEQYLGNTAIYEPISSSPHQLVQLPPNDDPSFRIQGGTFELIKALTKKIAVDEIQLNEQVDRVEYSDKKFHVFTKNKNYYGEIVVSTLPPNLLVNSIEFMPQLPENLVIVSQNTHTWMGESIKIGLRFDAPFWRNDRLSGTIFSNVGPVTEMYEHNDVDDQFFALKGFLSGAYFSMSKDQRLEIVLNQLKKYYGDSVLHYRSYEELIWQNENFTFQPYSGSIYPHQNNGNPIFQNSYCDNRLHIAGTETAQQFGGYMEGAIQSAEIVFDKILKAIM
ncbi:flavin monoamine oxidase family protein [Namhaeicola litoreus]|uniref:Flavin monoamine oxidase family protein n=1 Tax=Namhaeicola litoreus TaxID=1052145 RepID=A0ABW3Y0T4_9FLAO